MTDVSRAQPEESEVAVEIERRHQQPDLCTIYVTNVTETEQMTRWLTAKGDAFVDLQTCR